MATVIDLDYSGINEISVMLANAIKKFDSITAEAMTTAAIKARDAIRREIHPLVQGGPTRWTERGLLVRYARKNDLRAQVGYQYGSGQWEDNEFTAKAGGIASGRYMGLNARGGDRRPKSSELQLRRSRLIGQDKYLTPVSGAGIDSRGNVAGWKYQQMISRLSGFTAAGSSQNTSSRRKRRQTDYFIMRRDGAGYAPPKELGAEPVFIAKRIGRKGRGFKPAFFIVDQPNYERRFPIKSVAMREYARVFPQEFERGLNRELSRRGIMR